jgi:hypothetical protein
MWKPLRQCIMDLLFLKRFTLEFSIVSLVYSCQVAEYFLFIIRIMLANDTKPRLREMPGLYFCAIIEEVAFIFSGFSIWFIFFGIHFSFRPQV